jgi:D-lactate dehydrogenase
MDKIVFFEIGEWEKDYVEKLLEDREIFFTAGKVQDNKDEKIWEASIISTFIYSKLDKEVLDKFQNLKLIATRSTGYDHIDIDYCKTKGITVVNVPSYGAHSVAEHTFAVILAISRKLLKTVDRSRKNNFELEGLRGFDLAGKTLGVIGAGKIGSKVIKLAQAFEMNVLVYSGHKGEDKDGIRFVEFDDLLGASDIVTLHLPHTKETHHIINRENIKKFKKGSVLINTARGPLIETQAILEGLESGVLKAAGLDVLEEECNLKEERELLTEDFLQKCDIKTQLLNHVLIGREDVIFTSHNAFNSDEALQQILKISVDNISAFLSGSPKNMIGK